MRTKSARAVAMVVLGGAMLAMGAQAVVVDFTAAEGYTDQLPLSSHPDWNAQNQWTNQNAVGDGVIQTPNGDFIRGNYQALSWDNTLGSSLTMGARFKLVGSVDTNVTVSAGWKEGMYTLDVTEQLVASAPAGRMEAGLNLNRFTKELQLRAGGQTTVLGHASLFDGHTWELTVTWTKVDGTSYDVEASIDSLEDGADAFLASGTATPDSGLSRAAEAHGFFKALPSCAQNYGGLQLDRFSIETFSPPSLVYQITEFALAGADAILSWQSEAGAVYTVEGNEDLQNTNAWMGVPGFTSVTGTVNGTMSVTGLLDGVLGFYRLDGLPPPPIFFDDLESGAMGWTNFTGNGTTDWELGTPNYTGGARGVFTNAYSGVNAWGTGLTKKYDVNDSLTLRTPEIDLTDVPGAALTFYEVADIEATYDFGYIHILTNGVLVPTNLYAATGTTTEWTPRTVDLNTFVGQKIVIEFELYSDTAQSPADDWFGWAIDDIAVEKAPGLPPPPPPFTNSVIQLVLVDSSGTNNPPPDLVTIVNDMVIDLDGLGVASSNLNIRAEVDGSVGSVTFALTQATVRNQTESVAPYYLFGDTSGDPNDGTLNSGLHTLVATPWENAGGGGLEGTNLTVNFTISP